MTRALTALCIATMVPTVLAAQSDSVTTPADPGVRRRWLVLPGLGRSPETGWGVAFTVLTVATARDDSTTRPRVSALYALRTERAQTRVSLDAERWLPGNRRRLAGSLSYAKYPYSFFGIGDRTTNAAEERYVPTSIEGYAQLDQQLRRHVYALIGVRAGHQDVKPVTDGLLNDQLIAGSRTTRTRNLTIGIRYDSRDNIVSTRRGQYLSVAYGHSVPALGATYSYGRLDADWRWFREVATSHLVAANASVVGVGGTVPFDQFAVVGGGRIMRGYRAGRFRDRWVAAVQGEYRSPMLLLDRIGAIAFAGVGAAASRPGDIASARPFPSGGVGIRVTMDPVQRTSLRVDYALAAAGFGGLYLGLNQAF